MDAASFLFQPFTASNKIFVNSSRLLSSTINLPYNPNLLILLPPNYASPLIQTNISTSIFMFPVKKRPNHIMIQSFLQNYFFLLKRRPNFLQHFINIILRNNNTEIFRHITIFFIYNFMCNHLPDFWSEMMSIHIII